MWSTPKVNWKSYDYFNIEDWQRIRNNLEHVRDLLFDKGLGRVSLLDTDAGSSYEALPYVHLVNNMEANLTALRETFGVSFTENLNQKFWVDRISMVYRGNPSYQDWNRWETILLRIYESIQYIDTYVFTPISGTCRCGSERTLIRFSRGR